MEVFLTATNSHHNVQIFKKIIFNSMHIYQATNIA